MSVERPLRVVVIGAGIAGAAFSLRLAQRAGDRVDIVLLERSTWPRAKVCGCCLNHAAVECLDELGVGEACRDLGARVDAVRLLAPRRSAAIQKRPGLALLRADMDAMLVERARALGVRFEPQSPGVVTHAPADPRAPIEVRVRTPGGDRTIEADLVVASDGLGAASVASMPEFAETIQRGARFGVGGVLPAGTLSDTARPAPGTIHMHVGRHGYVGLVRLRDGSVNLAAALDPAWTRRHAGPVNAIAEILRSTSGGDIDLNAFTIRGTPLLTRSRPLVASRRVLLVGDSAGYVEPFTGEGMAWGLAGALRSAELVSAAALMSHRDESWADATCTAWNHWHREHITSRQRACGRLKPLLRSPAITRVCIDAMNTLPPVRSIASGIAQRLERPYFPGSALMAPAVSTGESSPRDSVAGASAKRTRNSLPVNRQVTT